MSVCTHVLQLLLMLGFANCFSWDIIVSQGKQLKFYNNGTLTHTEDIPLAENIYSITYDPVHSRLLFAFDLHNRNHQISSFDLSTKDIQPLVTSTTGYYLTLAYDPVTQLLFWREGGNNIYSYSLYPASTNKSVGSNHILNLNHFSRDIAVDSCGGYIYWITYKEIERARFDGSEREVLIDSTVYARYSLAIDQQTQKMYWTESLDFDDNQIYIQSADFSGKNRRTLYTATDTTAAGSLTVSNNFIYWYSSDEKSIWQFPKNLPQQLEAKLFSISSNAFWYYHVIAANYTIKDQLKGNQNCETPRNLIPNKSEPDCIDEKLCVHDAKVSGESSSDCTQGYTGEKCDISVCWNYCLQGNCSVSAEGLPQCRCKAGYSGQRCEINACHRYCLNNGVCSLNEEHHPVCHCSAGYEGERCAVPAVAIKCIQTASMLRDMLNADIPPVTQSEGVQTSCASTVV